MNFSRPTSITKAFVVPVKGLLSMLLLLTIVFQGLNTQLLAAEGGEEEVFEIKGFMVEGNTILPSQPLEVEPDSPLANLPTIQSELERFAGPGKTVAEIEEARASLEKTYHDLGYPTVLVNIPEQTIDDGFVKLEVVESTIRRIRITGNRYYTMENILEDLPSIREGKVIYLPHLQEELSVVNSNPDLRVEPLLTPGKTFGTVDVELKVKDRKPLHASLELNNRASTGTTALRLNGVVSYENLWQKKHSASVQFQTSPQKVDEVQVLAASYILPTPWRDDHRLAFYSVWSDSNTAFGEGFQMIGSGFIFGARYVMPLASYNLFSHNVSIGADYKSFEETASFFDENLFTPITYLPLNVSYNASLTDKGGVTSLSTSLNMAFRGLVSDQSEFEVKRYRASADYIYLRAGAERLQKLPWKSNLFVKVDGQLTDQPLISNEQYTAGGVESVRGYKESSSAGDNAIHSTVELSGPNLAEFIPYDSPVPYDMTPYLFFDAACLAVLDPLSDQEGNFTLMGTGLGLRGTITENYDYRMDLAWALKDQGDEVEAGDFMFNFLLKSHF